MTDVIHAILLFYLTPPARVGILLMTEVLAGSVTAAMFSGDPYGAGEAAGTVMILCAGLVEVLWRR